MLSHRAAQKFYDRFGARQDRQGFYEDAALDELVANANFEDASAVVEFGCGTGRFARRILERHLPRTATYRAFDQSATMVGLAQERLAPFGARVSVRRTDGAVRLELAEKSCDRYVSNYVLDLLAQADIEKLVLDAHRLLTPGGLLCVSGLTRGTTALSRITATIWEGVQRLRPALVGGCRPVELMHFVASPSFGVRHHTTVVAWTVPSEVLVAEALDTGP